MDGSRSMARQVWPPTLQVSRAARSLAVMNAAPGRGGGRQWLRGKGALFCPASGLSFESRAFYGNLRADGHRRDRSRSATVSTVLR